MQMQKEISHKLAFFNCQTFDFSEKLIYVNSRLKTKKIILNLVMSEI